VRPRGQATPAEDIDRDKDRLKKETDAFDRKQHAEDLAKAPGERGPKQPELEREDSARHGADGERHRHNLRPTLREQQRVPVIAAQSTVVSDQHQRRECHADRRKDDVEAQRERHLAPRRPQIRRKSQHHWRARPNAGSDDNRANEPVTDWINSMPTRSSFTP
jgi:hypothetical protein